MNYEDLFKLASQLGFPLIFIIGQLREWWYIRPHVALMEQRMTEALAQVERARANEERAVKIAERSHQLAEQALTQSKAIELRLAELTAETRTRQ